MIQTPSLENIKHACQFENTGGTKVNFVNFCIGLYKSKYNYEYLDGELKRRLNIEIRKMIDEQLKIAQREQEKRKRKSISRSKT